MSRPFLDLPDRDSWRTFASVYVRTAALFVLVFAGSEWLVGRHPIRVRIALPGEEAIPLVPAWTWVYSSIYLPLHAMPFALRSPDELRRLGRVLAGLILAAGVGFVLVPAELSHPPPVLPGSGATAALFRWADAVNLDHELFPSLHVALSATCLAVAARRAPRVARGALGLWVILIGVSTVLTHQHQVLDVGAGWALAAWAVRRYESA